MSQKTPKLGGKYAHYVLFVLVIVYVFNFIDRNILSILAEDIKADLGFTPCLAFHWRVLQMCGYVAA